VIYSSFVHQAIGTAKSAFPLADLPGAIIALIFLYVPSGNKKLYKLTEFLMMYDC
jgi:hypothetical protein